MAADISRNFNVYTTEELQSFAPALVGAPVYIEHVSVDSAAGKVTKRTYDPTSRCLLYEAEIYDPVIADKIRNGLIQHVSIGADYDALDIVDAKIPHGLSKPELSLVAVPGIPETNIQVLEHLKESLAHHDRGKVKLKAKEVLGETEVFCVFCSNPADYFVSICQPCVDKFSVPVARSVGVEKLGEKEIENIAERVAAKIGDKSSFEVEKLKTELNEAKAKQNETEGKLKFAEGAYVEANGKLTVANKTVGDLKKFMPGMDLLKDPHVLMAVSEALADFQSLRLSPMVENCSGFSQHMGKAIRNKILKYEAKLRA